MTDTPPPPELADTVPTPGGASDHDSPRARALWLADMDRLGDDRGYFEPLGDRHLALFIDEAPTLLVSFERAEDIRARPGQMPLALEIAERHGWSHLCVIAEGETWYRDPRVYGYFDRLIDEGFFEDFDSVLFMGAGVQAYAAAAFSVAAPGAGVLAICPRATMAPSIAGWDRRAPASRRLDFTTRYGYAPDMVEAASRVYVLHDPDGTEDAMHAALFRGRHVLHLRTRGLGGRVDWALGHMNLLQPLVEAAMDGSLTRTRFATLWRARRNFGPYLRGLLGRAEAAGRRGLEKRICRNVSARLQAPRFRKRLADLLAAEAGAAIAAEDSPPGS